LTESQWKWADLFIKGLGVALITGAISFYNINTQKTQNELARQETRLESTIQFASGQKTLDVNLGMQLFDDFIGHYLQTESQNTQKEIKETILMLRLIALNFQDVPINIKPLFEDLDERIKTEKSLSDIDREELQEQLIDVAEEVANRQAFRLTFLEGFLQDDVILEKDGDEFFDNTSYGVKVLAIKKDVIRVVIRKFNYNEKGERDYENIPREIGPFDLSSFDMPLVDNIKIDENWRIAVTLKKIEDKKAVIRLLRFRYDLAADRFDVKEMSRQFFDDPQEEPAWTSRFLEAIGF
jgi:hypothetical protein